MPAVGEYIKHCNVSTSAKQIINCSWRNSTKKQYQTYIKKWTEFATERSLTASSPSPEQLVDFLSYLYENGVNYSALATARSAVSSLVNDSVELGKHTLVRRFMKGAFNSRPSLTKRVDIWDPAIVLTSLKGYKQASLLTLRELTLKTTMLLALLSAQRVQTLVSLDIHHMTMGHNTITFHISQLMKQSRPKFHLKDIVFTEYPACRNLCIVTLLNEYLERTRALREGSRLLISFAKPHKAVTTSTVSRWLKLVLAQAGIHDWTAHTRYLNDLRSSRRFAF